MAMRTYLLYVSERQTDVDYWVDVITKSGPMILMDDITGLCKFAGLSPEMEAEAARIAVGLDIDGDALADAVLRTFLRGYANERRTGFTVDDYRLPAEAHGPMGESGNAVFNTPAFFEEVRSRVIDRLDRGVAEAGFVAS
jgi:hypothetical protein